MKRSSDALSVARTLKTNWRLVTFPANSGPQRDILEVARRPEAFGAKSAKFVITYTRYHWTGSEWIAARSQRPGMWEAEGPFPSVTHFPEIPAGSDAEGPANSPSRQLR